MYLIFKDDYLKHINDKVALYAMLRQLESAVGKLPACAETADVRSMMETYAAKIQEMWEDWNIPVRYLVTGDEEDLADLLEDELMEPEDAGYFCAESCDLSSPEDTSGYGEKLADIAECYLMGAAKKAAQFAETALDQAAEFLKDCEEIRSILYGDEAEDEQ